MNASDSTPADAPDIPDTAIPDAASPAAASPAAASPAAAVPAAASSGTAIPAAAVPAASSDVDTPTLGPAGDESVRELAEIPAVEVITRAAVMLMSAAAEKLGLAEDGARFVDRDEARRLITALAGLYAAAGDDLGAHRRPIADALRGLQAAFREAAPIPDPPGQGPGETLRRPAPL